MLWSFAKRIKKLYSPHFGFRKNKLWRSFCALLILAGNISLAFVMAFINTAFEALMGTLNSPTLTYTEFFASTGNFIGMILVYTCIASLNSFLSSWLGGQLAKVLNKSFAERWIKNKAFYGTKFMVKGNKKLNPAQIISQDSFVLSDTLAQLINGLLMAMSNFVVGVIGLYHLSGPLVIPFFFGMTLTIPGYMLLATVLYALTFNYITSLIGNSLRDAQSQEKHNEGELYHQTHHIKSHAESIAFKQGAEYEHRSFMTTLKKNIFIQAALNKMRSLLMFANVMHQQLASVFGVLISAPNLIARTMTLTDLFQVSSYFNHVVRLFTWKNENHDYITSAHVALDRLEAFDELLSEWELLQKNSQHLKHSEPNLFNLNNEIGLKNATVKTPDNKLIFDNFTLMLPRGRVTLIQGPSGIGKSTLFRCLANLWPYVQGELVLPVGHDQSSLNNRFTVYFIPQQCYFPYQKTLFEAFIYPLEKETLSHVQKEELDKEIVALMRTLQFEESTIDNRHTVAEWEKTLSGGEQQRVAIISAVIKRPQVLFMDEATSAMDNKTKQLVQNLLREILPFATIAYIDHNPSHEAHVTDDNQEQNLHKRKKYYRPFHDHIIELKKDKTPQNNESNTLTPPTVQVIRRNVFAAYE